jgi:hypothetical protein
MDSNVYKVTKLKQDYTQYNSCERPKNKMKNKLNKHMNTNKCKIYEAKYVTSNNISSSKVKEIDIDDGNEYFKKHKPDNDVNTGSSQRGRTLLEKHKNPKDRISRKFFSEEKYHYSQNLQIEEELRQFKNVPSNFQDIYHPLLDIYFYNRKSKKNSKSQRSTGLINSQSEPQ